MKQLRILVMSGTRYIGPHLVRYAAAQGHRVAVFNRGTRAVKFPASVKGIASDRTVNLDAIKNRGSDAVIDIAVYVPGLARSLGQARGLQS